MHHPNLIRSSGDAEVYADIASAIAGLAAHQAGSASQRTVRRVRCGASGTLVVTMASTNANAALPFAAAETQDVEITAIVSAGSSGCAPITLFYW